MILQTKLALTAAFGLALILTISCGEHNLDGIYGLGSSSSEEELLSSSQWQSSSSSQQQSSCSSKVSSSSQLGSSSSSVQSKIVYGDPVTYHDETYKTVVIGSQTWFQRNLNYAAKGSKCNKNNDANCAIYGRLYDWQTAISVCPPNWRLPNNEDWYKLFLYANDATAGKYLKAVSGWDKNGNGTDAFGFSALPGGYGGLNDQFYNYSDVGNWWSSSEDDSDSDSAYFMLMLNDDDNAYWYRTDKYYLFSVRCVQD
jgi:uncharacterized protein (TIGR02145 family)